MNRKILLSMKIMISKLIINIQSKSVYKNNTKILIIPKINKLLLNKYKNNLLKELTYNQFITFMTKYTHILLIFKILKMKIRFLKMKQKILWKKIRFLKMKL
jgi:hypothetical protein